MNQLKNLIGVEKIESMFAEDIEYFYPRKEAGKKKPKRKLRIEHLYWIPSLIYSRTYSILPRILKDIFFCLSIIHKSPSSKLFARTRYDELRTLIDIKISALALKRVRANTLDNVKETFSSGSYTTNLLNLSELDTLINDVINYANPSHAGARPYFKDGKNKKIEGSFSAYYTFSKKDIKKINLIISKGLDEDFNYHLSALAGYKCTLKDISYSLSIVYGENSNSEMHQDTYASVAKGFIYLQDVYDGNSPFEYLEGSYLDATYRSNQTNKAVLNNDLHSSGSTRLRGQELQEAVKKYKLKTFTGSKGLFVLANTAGYHRKGAHNSDKPRIILACGVKRKGVFSKLIINLLQVIKFKET
jgi:hypothetical protein|tara:strand:- start:471 stop:1547 length:1077 start_codon:yes stop_codon:yes gene_type:complete